MITSPLRAWRNVNASDRRTWQDFSRVLNDLSDVRIPGRRIALVMHSLNVHRLSVLCEVFEPAEAARPAAPFQISHAHMYVNKQTLRQDELYLELPPKQFDIVRHMGVMGKQLFNAPQ